MTSSIQLQALLFDLDGTLVNSDPLHFLTWQASLRQHGIDLDEAGYQQRISGRLNPDIVRDFMPQLSEDERRRLAEGKEAHFRELAHSLEPIKGLLQLLDWAEGDGLSLGLVTNAPRQNAEFMIEVLGLAERFDVTILAEEASAGKPDPAPYTLALERLAVPAEATLAFEDSTSGVRSAVAAGIRVVGIASTHLPDVLRQAGANPVVEDFTAPELKALLER
jgi:HAD superfamily hydrolase (TIGR01509 family)